MWTQGPEWTYVLWDQRAHSFLFAFKPTNEKLPYIRRIHRILGVFKLLILTSHLLPSPAGRRSIPLFPSQLAQSHL